MNEKAELKNREISIQNEKNRIRREMKAKRKELTTEQREKAGQACLEQLLSMPEVQRAKYVLLYLSYREELTTLAWIERLVKAGKTVGAPKSKENGEMAFYEICSENECESGMYGIPEPSDQKPLEEKLFEKDTVIVLPGLAFTARGERIGYGGGYYDRFLERNSNVTKIAVGYDFSVLETLPVEAHDMRVDYVITPKKMYH